MAQKDFQTLVDEKDGYLANIHACGNPAVHNTGVEMFSGMADDVCISDGLWNVYRSYLSFPTALIPNAAVITSANLYVYMLGVVKLKRFRWNALYSAELRVNVRNAWIGAALDWTDYTMGGTNIYSSSLFKSWGAGWKSFSVPTANISKSEDTDFTIYPNSDWESSCQGYAKYYLRWATVEQFNPALRPYLRINYTVKGRAYSTIIGAC